MSTATATSRRAELITRMLQHLLRTDPSEVSFRGLAEAAGVTRPTLKHHFGDHQGALRATMAEAGRMGTQHLHRVRQAQGDPTEVLTTLLLAVVVAWEHGLGALHRFGLQVGLDGDLGEAYLRSILDPTLDAFAYLLGRYHLEGVLNLPDARSGALSLVSPVVLALLHQHELGGKTTSPLDVPAFIQDHVARFVRGAR